MTSVMWKRRYLSSLSSNKSTGRDYTDGGGCRAKDSSGSMSVNADCASQDSGTLRLMKWRRAFDLFTVFIAGPLGLPYVLFMGAIRLKPSLVKYWALGWVKSIQDIWNGASLPGRSSTGT